MRVVPAIEEELRRAWRPQGAALAQAVAVGSGRTLLCWGCQMGFRLLAGNKFERVAGSQEHGLAPDRIVSRRTAAAEEDARRNSSMPHNAPTASLARLGERATPTASRHLLPPNASAGCPGGNPRIARPGVTQGRGRWPAGSKETGGIYPGQP
jgi:hypothetical protein